MRSLSDLFRNFLQLGYVTDDIDAAAAYPESSMGTGMCVKSYASSLGGGRPPVGESDPRAAFVVVDGTPADEWLIDVALVNAGPVNLEIIRWAQFGDSGEIRFGYLDMRAELGHFIEVMELGQPAARWLAQIDAASAA